MSDLLPYEEHLQQQWTNIPLPDEDAAWEDMRRRLEEDDDDRGFFWWWRPGCALWGLLLVLTGLGIWWAGSKHEKVEKEKPAQAQNSHQPNKPNAVKTDTLMKNRRSNNETGQAKVTDSNILHRYNPNENKNRQNESAAPIVHKNKPRFADKKSVTANTTTIPGSDAIDSAGSSSAHTPATATEPVDTTVALEEKTDSTQKVSTDTTAAKKPNPEKNKKESPFFFSTGLSLQQQLPIAGQKSTPYSAAGRKSSLADYIPSVYARLHYKDKWFLQAEFRYGAPQYSKEYVYHQVITSDSGINPLTTTSSSFKLKKTFYHQLPVSVHYQILPQWSVGGGVIWNKFYAAVSAQETIQRDNLNQVDSVIFKGIISTKKDTTGTFASSYFQAVFETQYKWKRLSIGARYAFGLQPYIRFTLPGQGPKEEKNSSVQLFLRFELWRSKRSYP